MAIHPKLSILLLIAPLVTSFAFIYQYSPLLLNDNDVKCGNTIAFTEIISRQRHCKKGSAATKHSCFIVSYATTSKHQHDGNHHEGRKRKRKKKNNHRHEETNNSDHQKPTSDTKKEEDDDDDDENDDIQEDTIRVRIWQALSTGEEKSITALAKAVGQSRQISELKSHLIHVEKQAKTISNKSMGWKERRGLISSGGCFNVNQINKLRLEKRWKKGGGKKVELHVRLK